MNIDKMKAGRDMDFQVFEKVFENTGPQLEWARQGTVPHYSTDIAAAMQVVEKVKDKFKDAQFAVIYRAAYDDPQKWIAGWRTERPVGVYWEWSEILGYAEASTAPLAICRAALKAVGVTNAA